jgi:PLD-like domain
MASVVAKKGVFSVRAHIGDGKTLLAFDFTEQVATTNLAGFTIECEPKGQTPYYIFNELQFQIPGNHAQVASEPPKSSVNAPIHKFRWLHVPGSVHQGTKPFVGSYTYVVTPRYFDSKQSLTPLDSSLSVPVTLNVGPFVKGNLELGFTRGFVQSQAFVNHFGQKALIRPKGNDLIFPTSGIAGSNAKGQQFTYADEYAWSGFTARDKVFAILNQVVADNSLHLDVCAYDLNEPDVVQLLLNLASEGRVRVILDNAALHHSSAGTKPEDEFESEFKSRAKQPAAILRGHFGRYAHDKVLIISRNSAAIKVLTGSTNFSVTGMYVNSNHVVVFNDASVATEYLNVFSEVWKDAATEIFENSPLAAAPFRISSANLPNGGITFSPHTQAKADMILQGLVDRVERETTTTQSIGSVLFAVMQIDDGSLDKPPKPAVKASKNTKGQKTANGSTNPVYAVLRDLHKKQDVFTYGISDSPGGIYLYTPGQATGVLVTGKPGATLLPPPFDQIPVVSGHQIHHKFVVCGFNGVDPVVYCGSSNLANGGEHLNGDNLLEIHDSDVVTAFAIEALALIDHFDFLDHCMKPKKGGTSVRPTANLGQAAVSAQWFLSTDDKWTAPYFSSKDLHSLDRRLFA